MILFILYEQNFPSNRKTAQQGTEIYNYFIIIVYFTIISLQLLC